MLKSRLMFGEKEDPGERTGMPSLGPMRAMSAYSSLDIACARVMGASGAFLAPIGPALRATMSWNSGCAAAPEEAGDAAAVASGPIWIVWSPGPGVV